MDMFLFYVDGISNVFQTLHVSWPIMSVFLINIHIYVGEDNL